MPSYRFKNLMFNIEKKGVNQINKSSFPHRFGVYSEIRTRDYEFQFNLKGEIKSIRGLNMNWPHPSEILKRTDANDWVYHSVGVSAGVRKMKEIIGEYYLPCPVYPTNALWNFNPYADTRVSQAFAAWYQLFGTLHELQQEDSPETIGEFVRLVVDNDDSALLRKKEVLHDIIGGDISVLPPDTRQVDYEVVPLMITDGCRYHCGFCSVKTDQRFRERTKENIARQIDDLKTFYGGNIYNYAGLFLGNHDALAADADLIEWAAVEAYEQLDFKNCFGKSLKLFLFGSADSLLKMDQQLFDRLEGLPYQTFLNIGLESVDEKTLNLLKKPTDVDKVKASFRKMLDINRDFVNVETTANFIVGDQLSPGHNRALKQLLQDIPDGYGNKGTIYLSPLMGSAKSESVLPLFYELKSASRLPTYLYLIQRM